MKASVPAKITLIKQAKYKRIGNRTSQQILYPSTFGTGEQELHCSHEFHRQQQHERARKYSVHRIKHMKAA